MLAYDVCACVPYTSQYFILINWHAHPKINFHICIIIKYLSPNYYYYVKNKCIAIKEFSVVFIQGNDISFDIYFLHIQNIDPVWLFELDMIVKIDEHISRTRYFPSILTSLHSPARPSNRSSALIYRFHLRQFEMKSYRDCGATEGATTTWQKCIYLRKSLAQMAKHSRNHAPSYSVHFSFFPRARARAHARVRSRFVDNGNLNWRR